MIDPMTALAGIQSAVALIKKVSKTVDDVSSLGPVLGKYFDAKSKATKAVHQVKTSGNKSNMAIAIEIEMALDQAAQFEKQLQLLFMQTGKIDVWNRIKARAHSMDIQEEHNAKKELAYNKRKQEQMSDIVQYTIATVLCLAFLAGISYGVYQLVNYCNKTHSCGR